jgi:hypothetical protein
MSKENIHSKAVASEINLPVVPYNRGIIRKVTKMTIENEMVKAFMITIRERIHIGSFCIISNK